MQKVVINRPWISSFNFGQAPYGDSRLEQVHKLSRNFIASLDLGCPHVRHVKQYQEVADAYRAWVKDWKVVYGEVSKLIRQLKSFRRTVRFPSLTPEQLRLFKAANSGVNENPAEFLNTLSARHLPRLQETAQVLLNARWNAKLASAEARRRLYAAQTKEGEKLAA